MRYILLPVLVTALAFSTWKYHDEINPLFQKQSQEKEKERGNVLPTLVEQRKELEKLKLQVKKISTKLNPKDRLFIKPAVAAFSGSLPLDTVFFLVLIHTCGADLVASVSAMCHHMSAAGGLVDLAFSFILAVFAMYKWKREKAELVKKNAHLRNESLNKEKDRDDVLNTLTKVKTELENQRGQLKLLLEEVERDKEVNKQKLQEVEKEITEKEMTCDKPEELLREKENLLRAQWKLDQKKKDNKRQLLNTEKLLEPIEIQVTRIHRTKGEDMQVAHAR